MGVIATARASNSNVGSTDVELARRVAARDGVAASLIVRRNNQRLFRVAIGILKNRAEAEDALQSSYLRAFAAITTFDGRSSLATWLTRIVINEALGRARSASRRRARFDDESIAVIEEYRDKLMRGSMHAASPDAEFVRQQLRIMLEQAIAMLPGEFRLTFMLREVEGLSIDETAEALGIPAATVKTRHLRARRRLQQALDPEIRSVLNGTFPFCGEDCAALTARVLDRLEQHWTITQGDGRHV
ncbi:MAG: RNA polymerase sigma factor [Sphingomonadaceae bacterium]